MDRATDTAMQACMELCWECRHACQVTLYGHCLEKGGRHVEAAHVRLMADCIQICQAAADFMSRGSALHNAVCRACAEVCEACSKSCRAIGGSEMESCADVCAHCAESCRRMAA
jgi:hypothetical protein